MNAPDHHDRETISRDDIQRTFGRKIHACVEGAAAPLPP
jgi:hypothetical protein